jgi:monofunctional glycosyltransferase
VLATSHDRWQGAAGAPGRQRGSIFGRLLRLCVIAVIIWLPLSIAPVLALRWLRPLTSAFMLEAQAQAWLAEDHGYRTDFEWVSLERISPNAAIAVIASEDQQFPYHAGFDFDSIREAIRASERGRRLRGASTLTQQVAKNLFLWSGRSFVRKGLEAYFTVLIEALWPKERILEMYLNIAQFGDGIYGVQAAAHRFWRQPARQLSSSEAALLAAVLPNPLRLHADRPSAYVLERRDWILGQMRRLGGAAYLRALENEQHPRERHEDTAPAKPAVRPSVGPPRRYRPPPPRRSIWPWSDVMRDFPAVASAHEPGTDEPGTATWLSANSPRRPGAAMGAVSFRTAPGAWTGTCCAPGPRASASI